MAVLLTDKLKFIQSVFGSGKLSRTSKNIDVWCPICAPGDKSKKKLSIRLEDDANHCWTCEWKSRSLAPLVKKYGTRDDLITYRDKFMVGDKRRVTLDDDDEELPPLTLPKDAQLLVLASTHDPDVKAALRYAKTRNLDEHDLWYYRVCVSDEYRWKRRLIFPSFDVMGKLNYFVARSVDEQRKPKYDNPDFDKRTIIFNEMNIDWKKRLVLCEGAVDMCKCGDNAVPLLGSSLNEESLLFNTIIANNTPIALALDADMIESRVPAIAAKLTEYDVDVQIVDVRPFADPGKMTRLEFGQKLREAHQYAWIDSFSSKLARATKTSLSL